MRHRSLAALAVALASVAPLAAAPVTAAALEAAAAPETVAASITLVGHGNGHGVGLGQWGVYGYAVDAGWDAWRIVDHYYDGDGSGTLHHGSAPLDAIVTVRLQALDGTQTAVVSDADLNGMPGIHAMVARMVPGAGFSVWTTPTPACPSAADPLVGWTQVAAGLPTATFATAGSADPATPAAQLVSTCRPDGTLRAYRGRVLAATGTAGEVRTVNAVPVEQYLRAVVAKEMSPSWALAGGGRGLQALAAQAIAGRSYALSEHLYSYAMTCDSFCQTYQGAATRASLGAPFVAVEHPLSDPAVTGTAGQVLLNPDDSYVHAMYAASTVATRRTTPCCASAGPRRRRRDAAQPEPHVAPDAHRGGDPGRLPVDRHLRRDHDPRPQRPRRPRWPGDGDDRRRHGRIGAGDGGDQFRSAMGLKSNWFAAGGRDRHDHHTGDRLRHRHPPAQLSAPLRVAASTFESQRRIRVGTSGEPDGPTRIATSDSEERPPTRRSARRLGGG